MTSDIASLGQLYFNLRILDLTAMASIESMTSEHVIADGRQGRADPLGFVGVLLLGRLNPREGLLGHGRALRLVRARAQAEGLAVAVSVAA